jgi:hypothetical protein
MLLIYPRLKARQLFVSSVGLRTANLAYCSPLKLVTRTSVTIGTRLSRNKLAALCKYLIELQWLFA